MSTPGGSIQLLTSATNLREFKSHSVTNLREFDGLLMPDAQIRPPRRQQGINLAAGGEIATDDDGQAAFMAQLVA